MLDELVPAHSRVEPETVVELRLQPERDQVIAFQVIEPETKQQKENQADPGCRLPFTADCNARSAEEIERGFAANHDKDDIILDRYGLAVGLKQRDLFFGNLFDARPEQKMN